VAASSKSETSATCKAGEHMAELPPPKATVEQTARNILNAETWIYPMSMHQKPVFTSTKTPDFMMS